MSYPPEVKLGREDLAKLRIYEHRSDKCKLHKYEKLGFKFEDARGIASLMLWELEYPNAEIARILGVSRKTTRRWRKIIKEER